jgi:hypothetical protein
LPLISQTEHLRCKIWGFHGGDYEEFAWLKTSHSWDCTECLGSTYDTVIICTALHGMVAWLMNDVLNREAEIAQYIYLRIGWPGFDCRKSQKHFL